MLFKVYANGLSLSYQGGFSPGSAGTYGSTDLAGEVPDDVKERFLRETGLLGLFEKLGDDWVSVQDAELATGHEVFPGEFLDDYLSTKEGIKKLTDSKPALRLVSLYTKPAKRGTAKGWTAGVARRNTNFLMSVKWSEIPYTGYAVTLTIPAGDIPDNEEWGRMRKNLIENGMKNHGWKLVHWLTEFTRNGTPHLHMSVFADSDIPQSKFVMDILSRWDKITSKHGYKVSLEAQNVKKIQNEGWYMYQAKHGSRGQAHYQRREVPESWLKSTGRVWGKNGDWSEYLKTPEETRVDSYKLFCQMRRIAVAVQIRQAKKMKNAQQRKNRLKSIRRSLRHKSEVKPIRMFLTQNQIDEMEQALAIIMQPVRKTPRQARIEELTAKYR